MQLWCNCHLLQVTMWIEKPNFSHHHHPETLTRGHEVHDTMKQNGNRKHHPGGFLKWSTRFGVMPIIQAGGFTVVGIQLRDLNLDAKANHKSQCPRSPERAALPLWGWGEQHSGADDQPDTCSPDNCTGSVIKICRVPAHAWEPTLSTPKPRGLELHSLLKYFLPNTLCNICTGAPLPLEITAAFSFTKKFTLNWTVRREICAV